MAHLPICLDLSGRSCLVVGGGAVAARKVATLLEAGARVEVVSPRLTNELERWARDGTIGCRLRPYREEDLDGHELVFVAAGDPALNRSVAKAARARSIWINAADDPDNCDFVLPSLLRRGSLTVAVSTGGRSPAFARMIREELEERLPAEYGAMLECAAEVRGALRQGSKHPSGEVWRRALDGEFRRLAAQGDGAGAKAHLLDRLRDEA